MATVVTTEVFGIENYPSVKVVVFRGQIDESNLPEVSKVLDAFVIDPATKQINQETKYIVLNFNELSFINSKVIGYLASLYSTASEHGKKLLIIVDPKENETITDILSLVGLTTIIDHYPNLEEAIEVVKTDIEQDK